MPSVLLVGGSCCCAGGLCAIGSLVFGGKRKKIEKNKILQAAEDAGLRVYSGFSSPEPRIVFPHEDKCGPARHKLKTILVTGEQEGKDVTITSAKKRGLVTWPYEQTLDDEFASRWMETPFVWKKQGGENALAHMWTININEEFEKVYDHQTTPLEGFHEEAAENVKKVARELFGEDEANRVDLWYCTKKPSKQTNRQQVYVGTSSQFQEFLSTPGVMDALDINSAKGNKVTTATVQKGKKYLCGCIVCPGKKTGQKEFNLCDDEAEMQVLYKRQGYTSFMCFKPLQNFEADNKLMGLMSDEQRS